MVKVVYHCSGSDDGDGGGGGSEMGLDTILPARQKNFTSTTAVCGDLYTTVTL